MQQNELFERLLSFASGNQSVGISVWSDDKSNVPDRTPDVFRHYETKMTDGQMQVTAPVEHADAETVPLGEQSFVVAVWQEDSDITRTMSPRFFEQDYRTDSQQS